MGANNLQSLDPFQELLKQIPSSLQPQQQTDLGQRLTQHYLPRLRGMQTKLSTYADELKARILEQKIDLESSDSKEAVGDMNRQLALLMTALESMQFPSSEKSPLSFSMSLQDIKNHIDKNATSNKLSDIPIEKFSTYVKNYENRIKNTTAYRNIAKYEAALESNEQELKKVEKLLEEYQQKISAIETQYSITPVSSTSTHHVNTFLKNSSEANTQSRADDSDGPVIKVAAPPKISRQATELNLFPVGAPMRNSPRHSKPEQKEADNLTSWLQHINPFS